MSQDSGHTSVERPTGDAELVQRPLGGRVRLLDDPDDLEHFRCGIAEHGHIIPVGASRVRLQIENMVETAELSGLAKNLFGKLIDEYRDLDARISALDEMLVEICRTNERCKRLTTLPVRGRSSQPPWSPQLTMVDISNLADRFLPGSAWFLDNILPAESRGSAVSATGAIGAWRAGSVLLRITRRFRPL